MFSFFHSGTVSLEEILTTEKKCRLENFIKKTHFLFANFSGFLICEESKAIFSQGADLLKHVKTQEEFDQILIGTIFFALANIDWKYRYPLYKCISPNIRQILSDIIEKEEKENPNISNSEVIKKFGYETLIKKTVPFNGLIPSSIRKRFPFIPVDHFACYLEKSANKDTISLKISRLT